MNEYKLLTLSPNDIEALREIETIEKQAFGDDGISIFNISLLAYSGSIFGLANSAGIIVAEAVILRNMNNDSALVFAFAVKTNFQKKGIGTILIKLLIDLGKKTNISFFELTMNPDNIAAKKLYMGIAGFIKKTEITNHPQKKEPRWLMHLDLN